MSKASEKGYRGEVAVQAIFAEHGLESYRPRAGAPEDKGDLLGIKGLTIQVRNYDDLTRAIRDGLLVLAEQKIHNDTAWGVLAVPRRRHGWLAVMPLPEYARLYARFQEVIAERDALEAIIKNSLRKENTHELRPGGDEVRAEA